MDFNLYNLCYFIIQILCYFKDAVRGLRFIIPTSCSNIATPNNASPANILHYPLHIPIQLVYLVYHKCSEQRKINICGRGASTSLIITEKSHTLCGIIIIPTGDWLRQYTNDYVRIFYFSFKTSKFQILPRYKFFYIMIVNKIHCYFIS